MYTFIFQMYKQGPGGAADGAGAIVPPAAVRSAFTEAARRSHARQYFRYCYNHNTM